MDYLTFDREKLLKEKYENIIDFDPLFSNNNNNNNTDSQVISFNQSNLDLLLSMKIDDENENNENLHNKEVLNDNEDLIQLNDCNLENLKSSDVDSNICTVDLSGITYGDKSPIISGPNEGQTKIENVSYESVNDGKYKEKSTYISSHVIQPYKIKHMVDTQICESFIDDKTNTSLSEINQFKDIERNLNFLKTFDGNVILLDDILKAVQKDDTVSEPLNYVKFSLEKYIEVSIAEVNNCRNFYLYVNNETESFNENFNDYYQSYNTGIPCVKSIKLKSLYCIYNKKDDRFYRGLLLRHAYMLNYWILLVDYGKLVTVPVNHFYELVPEFKKYPIMALNCFLSGKFM